MRRDRPRRSRLDADQQAGAATRALAGRVRENASRDAAEWHQRGLAALAAGDSAGAVERLRRATQHDHDNRAYAVSLASALAASLCAGAARAESVPRELV